MKTDETEKVCEWCNECHPDSCSIETTVDFVGKKFSLLILRDLFKEKKPVRFNAFLKSIKRITPKTLSMRLKELEKSGLLKKTIFPEVPLRVEYSLTKKGKALGPILEALSDWGKKNAE
ncbi:MAG TPA: helix-turn-helix domain-containing protein [archaeon]|nr:helix-turn-helix domain-containing protein [archaeon]